MRQNKIFAAVLIAAVVAVGSLFFIPGLAKAALSTNASADVVIGQTNMTSNSANQGNAEPQTNTFYQVREVTMAGDKLVAVDTLNHRVLIYNSLPTTNNASADVVIGQPNMTSGAANQGGLVGANTLYNPTGVFYDGSKLFIADLLNHRVLIYNSLPTTNNASADVVIGQPNMTSNTANQGGAVGANTFSQSNTMFSDGKKLFVSDWANNRVLIFNNIPTSNNTSADIVIGQQNMTSNTANQGGAVGANTIQGPSYVFSNGKKLVIADRDNNRVLVYNSIPVSNNTSADVVVGQSSMSGNSADQGGAVGANTLDVPRIAYFYGPKLLIADSDNNRVLVYNSIPVSNNTSADVVMGQTNMSSEAANQGGLVSANTLYSPRGIFIKKGKLLIGDFGNNRVLIYNSFGSQWTITKNHSKTLSGDEKIKVKKKKLEFSGKKAAWKKGRVKIYRDGSKMKTVKIKNSGKWKASFKDTGSAVKEFVIKYYDSSGTLQMNSETYVLGIDRGSLSEATLEKAEFLGSVDSDRQEKSRKPEKVELPELGENGG